MDIIVINGRVNNGRHLWKALDVYFNLHFTTACGDITTIIDQ